MKKSNEKADNLYKKMVLFCERANKLTKKGYVMLNKDGRIFSGTFVFESLTEKDRKGIFLKHASNHSTCFVVKDTISMSDNKTLYQEYKDAYKQLSKLFFVKHIDGLNFFHL